MKIVFIMLVIVFCGCATTTSSSYTKQSKPREDQRRWIDERAVIDSVVYCVNGAKFASSRPAAVKNYASLLRQCYAAASLLGQDVDAGVRALNFIHSIHYQAKGDKTLWNDALELAKVKVSEDSPNYLPGIEPPQDYK